MTPLTRLGVGYVAVTLAAFYGVVCAESPNPEPGIVNGCVFGLLAMWTHVAFFDADDVTQILTPDRRIR